MNNFTNKLTYYWLRNTSLRLNINGGFIVWVHPVLTPGICLSFLLSVLMLDEAHERTLYTDIAIGLLKKVASVHVSFNAGILN